MLNKDYRDILHALYEEKVEFLLAGAYAMAAHGFPRATMDIDFWILPSPKNAQAVFRALEQFGAPLDGISPADFETEGMVFQIGVAPRRIDLITEADGLCFDETFAHAPVIEIEGIPVHVISKDDLILNKRAAGRTKDLADVEMLESKTNGEI